MRLIRVVPAFVLASCTITILLAMPAATYAATPTCGGKKATKVGTARSERIVGTARADVIFAGTGHDVVIGGGGNDIICGAGGNDTLVGGAGNDRLLGGLGADRLDGSRGSDACQDVSRSTFVSCELPLARLTVHVDGSGRVASSSFGVQCGLGLTDCTDTFGPKRIGTTVTLTATPGLGQRFTGWVGCPSAAGATCTTRMNVSRTIRAAFAAIPSHALTVTVNGSEGIVNGPTGTIGCPTVCSASFLDGTSVTLTATALGDAVFNGWGGACSGTSATCTVTMSEARSVSASFTPRYTLSITNLVAAAGTVTDTTGGISCHTDCQERYLAGTQVTLTATASTGFTFTGWSGGSCSGTGTCTITMSEARAVTASFSQNSYLLTVGIDGDADGSVSGWGISCPGTCEKSFLYGTTVTLTAAPDPGSSVTWTGCTSSSGTTCTVSMSAVRTVQATFTVDRFELVVSTEGNGTVAATDGGISCPGDCREQYPYPTMVTLVATPAFGYSFAGWSGSGCSGTSSCVVTMTEQRTVTATFTLNTYELQVSTTGTGSGTVTASGISCPGDCVGTFAHGTTVTLTATPSTGSTVSWSGGCTPNGTTCTVSMTNATSVLATFTLNTYALTVARSGNGSVTSTPVGISCPSTCSAQYSHDTQVTLTATASAGYTFTGWSGACSGTATCVVAMTQPRSVTATFTLNTYELQVTTTGNASGGVSATGISCPGDCTETYQHGATVTLTASPATGSTVSWSGCSPSGNTCSVSMTQARSVQATFTLQTFTVTVNRNGTGTGAVSGTGISCGTDCTEQVNYGTQVTLTPSPDASSTFQWTGGPCGGTSSCTFTVTGNVTVSATFTLRSWQLQVSRQGPVVGTVTSSPSGINCGFDCTETFTHGQTVALTASPSLDADFSSWGGDCVAFGSDPTCTLSMTGARNVVAYYEQAP